MRSKVIYDNESLCEMNFLSIFLLFLPIIFYNAYGLEKLNWKKGESALYDQGYYIVILYHLAGKVGSNPTGLNPANPNQQGQGLVAILIMIAVLIFILAYCCWGAPCCRSICHRNCCCHSG